MVLLNGVKYACERCIRGHRVSSCTHTDKPLTMIKPKGRPASQCPHCREQRKLKNTHSSCSCGKKGKSPGTHLASCLCHRNSHCTCPTKDVKVKKEAKKGEKTITPTARTLEFNSFNEEMGPSGLDLNQNYMIEDVLVPFETDQGLLDFLATNESKDDDEGSGQNGSGLFHFLSKDFNIGHSEKPLHPQQLQGLNHFPNPPSDSDLDLMENMFPLFPLVGTSSFDDSKSLPLLPLPYLTGTSFHNSTGAGVTANGIRPHGKVSEEGFSAARMNMTTSNVGQLRSEGVPPPNGVQNVSGGSNTPHQVHSASNHQSSTSLSTMNTVMSSATHHPHPLKSSASFSNYNPHQTSRPRRPESVLSTASTSSNTSKQNLLDSSITNQHHIPKLSSSAAFPPFHLSEINSTDDLQNTYFESSGAFNDAQLLSILSDYEEFKNGHAVSVSATPQSSLPSRQPLQLRRKTSLSRSHSQLHHNQSTMNKEHPLLPLKSASSSESSPRQPQHFFSPSSEQNGHFKSQTNSESHLRQQAVSEEWAGYQNLSLLGQGLSGAQNSPSPLGQAGEVQSVLDDGFSKNQQKTFQDFVDYLEVGSVPMFQEFVAQ